MRSQEAVQQYTWSHGGVIRAPRDRKRMALVFTGGDFADGLMTVLDALEEHEVPGSFFFTGDFYRRPEFRAGIERAIAEDHYLGPHSDKHLLYAPWDDRSKTLVTREQFAADLEANVVEMEKFGIARRDITWWIPPYEWYNEDISRWSIEEGIRLFNFTPGTVSHTDYMEDDDPRFRSSDEIFRNILEFESREPDGLNGFLLLIHQGASPRRTDKFYTRLSKLITELELRGYEFARVDELLKDAPTAP